jgi:hypothetical protein
MVHGCAKLASNAAVNVVDSLHVRLSLTVLLCCFAVTAGVQ